MGILRGNLEILPNEDDEQDLLVAGTVTASEFVGLRETTTITGDGSTVNFFVTHTLGVKDVEVTLYDDEDNRVIVAYQTTSIGNLVVMFAEPPALNETFTVVINK